MNVNAHVLVDSQGPGALVDSCVTSVAVSTIDDEANRGATSWTRAR
jgi:hypothetical protein